MVKALSSNVRRLTANNVLVEAGMPATEISVILEGWACRLAGPGKKRRQIVALYLPGDICDFNAFLLPASDQDIVALTTVKVAGIGRATMNALSQNCPKITYGMWRDSAVAAAIQRR